VSVTAYELDPFLSEYLRTTLALCRDVCKENGVTLNARLHQEDFIEAAVSSLRGGLFAHETERFDCAILNPPYRKINSDSRTRRALSTLGIEASNLYTAFLSLAIRLLEPGGQLVAITPRSFCNGPYFKPFREEFLKTVSLTRVHVYESRSRAFSEDDVLQENVIVHAVRHPPDSSRVVISSSMGPEDDHFTVRELERDEVVRRGDPNHFIHIVPDGLGQRIAERMAHFTASLATLSIAVSTGRVVDFRAKQFLRAKPSKATVPLIYPTHFDQGRVRWPKPETKKPNAIAFGPATADLLVPSGVYVLVKRFSSKEEKRRIVAAVFDPLHVSGRSVAFENHLNYFHRNGKGLPKNLARGLAAFLNSTLVDAYFRQFNGHTQVNATDLRSLYYPTEEQLVALGARIGSTRPNQDEIDGLIEEELIKMPDEPRSADPVRAKKRIEEAIVILNALGLPREQQNERSALTLLALLGLKPDTPWSQASDPLMGITPMMDFFRDHYGKMYAPNTRETVRRQTVHQFLDAGLIVENPDDPSRAVNSAKTVYQIETGALVLLRSFGTSNWEKNLRAHLGSVETLKTRYAREREMRRIPVTVAKGRTISLTPGGQNVLIEQIIKEFCERFTPGGNVIYVGDTGEKFAHFDRDALAALGVTIEKHGKMPDVVIHHRQKGWLVLIEAVTSHGPVNPKRRSELERLFAGSRAGLVFVTAFLDRRAMVKHLGDISWETEVWVAESPSHMIHFNGERFLGPF
jgi:adenine-specific DNA-methyltransferase